MLYLKLLLISLSGFVASAAVIEATQAPFPADPVPAAVRVAAR